MKQILKGAIILAGMSVALAMNAPAQTYDLKQMPPPDPKVRTGVLDNGMHYYIRANRIPENRAEFYIAHNVGAIQEEDDQNGLAHFTEHMAFNGTLNFPKKTLLEYLATIGVKFGTNVNASTGLERTVYNVSNVPLKREGVIDSALLILHDWSNCISFEPGEIDLERGVIREEWRMYGSASERMSNELAPVLYEGSKYAKRNVIGDTAVINHFKYETIRSFYKKWYRPDLQAIVVIGDFDEAVMEARIRKLFGGIPKAINPAAKEFYPVPDNGEPLIGTARDKEATSTVVTVYYKHDAIPDREKNLGYMRLQLLRRLVNTMFGQRMTDLAGRENPPFLSARCYYGQYTQTKDAFSGTAQAANNAALTALSALLTEMQRMKQFGFTAPELERAKAEVLRTYESRYMERERQRNRELVMPNISNFLSNNPNPGIEFDYNFTKTMLPGISLDEVNGECGKYVRNDNTVIAVTGPDKEGITLPGQQEIKTVVEKCQTTALEPWVDKLAGKKLLEKDPEPGKLVSTTQNQVFGATEWTLSNGIRVILKPTENKEDELIIRGFSPGGISLLPDDLVPAAGLFGEGMNQLGVGQFSRPDLGKMLAGKRAMVIPGLSRDQQTFFSLTSPKDMETALQLIYLYFTSPRWDQTDYATWIGKVKARYVNLASDPRTAMTDTVAEMMSDHNPRALPMTFKRLDLVSLEKLKSIYAQRFADPGSFTFLFTGKINPADLKPLCEKYLASLPSVNRKESARDDGIRPPAGKVKNDFSRENKTPRTTIYLNLNGACGYSAEDRLMGAALRHILELRYVQSVREDEGGAYSVRVGWSLENFPKPSFQFIVRFDTDPAKADKLVDIVHREITKLLTDGPTESDLQKAKEYFLKQRPEDMKDNTWWDNMIYDYYFTGMDFLTGYEPGVTSLSTKALHGYAKKTLSQGNEVLVIMRP